MQHIPTGSWLHRKDELQEYARTFDPHAILVTKDHWFWIVLSFFVTKHFLRKFATTFLHIQGYPRTMLAEVVKDLIPHESRHTTQTRFCSPLWWIYPTDAWLENKVHVYFGFPIFLILWGLAFLPLGLALGRAWLELDADRAVWRLRLSEGASPRSVMRRAQWCSELVSSSAYGWAWPKKALEEMFLTEVLIVIREKYGRYQPG